MKSRRARVVFGNGSSFDAELAVTRSELEMGLRGRVGAMPMLFVFSSLGSWPMTMRGVWFDLDMVMLDDAGIVVGVSRAPAGAVGPFACPAPYKYVLELPAGWAEGFSLRRGMRAAVVPMAR